MVKAKSANRKNSRISRDFMEQLTKAHVGLLAKYGAQDAERHTVEEVFDLNLASDDGNDERFNNRRALLGVSYLLSYSSSQGNRAAEGFICEGLAHTLKLISSKLPP